MERDFHVYDMDLPALKILYPTRWIVRTVSLHAILKNYGTLMKLWGRAQDNVSDSDVKAKIIGVQTKIQTFSFFYGLQLVIQITSAQAFRAQNYAMDAQKNPKF